MEEKRFTLRMDGDLFEEISELAKKNRRSTAKEVEYAIAFYLHDLASKTYLNELDLNNMPEEEARKHLRHLRDINKKYDVFLKS